jgi:hypothetical protein
MPDSPLPNRARIFMHATIEAFMAMSAEQKRSVHLQLCGHALKVWEKHFPPGSGLAYRESVVGTLQFLETGLPREALESIREGRDLAYIEDAYGEPIAALYDDDLKLPEPAMYAYYAIYNAFQLHVLGKAVDPLLIVKQALSAVEDHEMTSVFQQALDSVS